jgi:hypothetical protein
VGTEVEKTKAAERRQNRRWLSFLAPLPGLVQNSEPNPTTDAVGYLFRHSVAVGQGLLFWRANMLEFSL